jgi:hypothetical protein
MIGADAGNAGRETTQKKWKTLKAYRKSSGS